MDRLLQTDWLLLCQLSFPLILLLVAGLICVLLAPFLKNALFYFVFSTLVLFVAFVDAAQIWLQGPSYSMALLLFDRMAYSFDLIILLAAFLSLFLSKEYIVKERIHTAEYMALVLFATAGAMLISHGADLIVVFLGIEIMSLSAYILAGMKDEIRSYEASLKYFILGSFASGFLLYGIALMYGAAGSTSFSALQQLTIPPAEPILVLLSVAMLLIGIGFKIAAAPFHLWTPDVYEGSPTPITAFMASAIKTAGFAALVRIVLALGHIPQIPWVPVLTLMAALTMTIGNVIALRQTNLKRILAYSSIAHAGYALVGVTAALQKNALTESTLGAVIFYLFAYSLMTIGAFAIVIALGRSGDDAEELSDLSGLSEKHPFLSASLAVFLFSLTGFPPTIGFMGKFYLFSGAIEAGLTGLVIVGVINSAISAYYYLGPVVKMYFQKEKEYRLPHLSYILITGIFVCLFVVVYLGIQPSEVFVMARESVRELVF